VSAAFAVGRLVATADEDLDTTVVTPEVPRAGDAPVLVAFDIRSFPRRSLVGVITVETRT